MLNMEHLAIYFIFTLVMIVALFNVVGALIMMIIDKKAQMKIVQSMGATSREVYLIFFILGLLICIVGGGVGLSLGVLLVLLQSTFPFIYVPGTSLAYPVVFAAENLLIVIGTLLVLGTLSTAWASRGLGKEMRNQTV